MTSAPDSEIAAIPAAESSALLTLLPHVLQTLKREPALALTLAYLLVAMAGIFYDVSFYEKFGIPVLTLSQISDFLVAGIQQPIALVLVLSTFPICWVFDRINSRSRVRHGAERDRLRALAAPSPLQRLRLKFLDWRVGQRWYTQLGYVAVIVLYGWSFVGLYAQHRASLIKHGDAAEVEVWMNGSEKPLAAKSAHWSYLGAVSNYVFVYDRAGARAAVLPVNAVARIEPVGSHEAADRIMLAPIP